MSEALALLSLRPPDDGCDFLGLGIDPAVGVTG